MTQLGRVACTAAVIALAAAGAGCSTSRHLLAFATATTFGLDISLRADDNLNVQMGYDRVEIASIPVPPEKDAAGKDDAYSVLGYYHVDYGNPWIPDDKPLTIKQLFATGRAALSASKGSNGLQDFLGQKAGNIAGQPQ